MKQKKVGFPAADSRAVQRVAGPQLVRPRRLEPAEHLLLPFAGGQPAQLQAGEQPLQRPVRRHPPGRPGLGRQDPGDLGGGPLRVLPLQRRRQHQQVSRRPGRGLPRRRDQRLEPAAQVGPLPPVDALIRHPHLAPVRPGVGGGGKLAHPPAPLRGCQVRAGHLLDQRIPEQRDRPRPLQPPPLVRFFCCCHCCPPRGARGCGPVEGGSQ